VFWRYVQYISDFTDRLVHRFLAFGCCVWPTVIALVALPPLPRPTDNLMSFILVQAAHAMEA